MLHWLKVNSSRAMHHVLLEFLLHPLVRSFRTRDAIGSGSTEYMISTIETFPLSQTGSGVPSVLVIYALFGQQTEDNSEDVVYVGQGGSTKQHRDTGRGIRHRSTEHYRDILKCRDKPPVNGTAQNDPADARKGALWVHRRVASMQSSISALGVENLHFRFLLILAETLDILLLNSLRIKDSKNATAAYRLSFGTNLEPLDLPRWKLEGVNCALPSKQHFSLGASILSMHWSPVEIGVFVDIV
ncbi:hypothetical protein F4678DRAFT_475281 [Xylaria arbuscula]|nr:hypothetical protein F4678DRAFT_475281 [Xylaria arbuscula]